MEKSDQAKLASYVTGFVLSVILTLSAYLAVVNNVITGNTLIAFIIILAAVQLMVQLVFFLHLGNESKPRWKSMVFLFMLLVLGIVVFGSLWIMNNLDYHMVPTESYIIEDEGIHE